MRLTELVRQRPSPTRRQILRRSVLAMMLGAVWWGGGLALLGVELGERPWGWLLATLAVWTASGALGGYFALSSGGSALGRPRPLLARLAVAILLLLLVASVALAGPDGSLQADEANSDAPTVVESEQTFELDDSTLPLKTPTKNLGASWYFLTSSGHDYGTTLLNDVIPSRVKLPKY